MTAYPLPPERAQPVFATGRTVWAVATGEYDESYAVQYRIAPAEEGDA